MILPNTQLTQFMTTQSMTEGRMVSLTGTKMITNMSFSTDGSYLAISQGYTITVTTITNVSYEVEYDKLRYIGPYEKSKFVFISHTGFLGII